MSHAGLNSELIISIMQSLAQKSLLFTAGFSILSSSLMENEGTWAQFRWYLTDNMDFRMI